jgi:hypothetical protein
MPGGVVARHALGHGLDTFNGTDGSPAEFLDNQTHETLCLCL